MFSLSKETTVFYLLPTMTQWNSARWARKVLSFLYLHNNAPHTQTRAEHLLIYCLSPHLWNKFCLVWRWFKKHAFWWHVYKHWGCFEWAVIFMVGAIQRCFGPTIEKSSTACTDNSSWIRCVWETFWSMLTLWISVKVPTTSFYVEK